MKLSPRQTSDDSWTPKSRCRGNRQRLVAWQENTDEAKTRESSERFEGIVINVLASYATRQRCFSFLMYRR